MPRRLSDVGLDPRFVAVAHPAIYADLNATCASCFHWQACTRDIAAGEGGGDDLARYCPNVSKIDALMLGLDSDR